MSQKDHWWLFHIRTKKNIVFRKNGWEGTLPYVTQGSEFNNDKDPKKVLDTQAETTHKRDHTDMSWMSEILHNCICSPSTRSTIATQNKWIPIIPSDWTGSCEADDFWRKERFTKTSLYLIDHLQFNQSRTFRVGW